MANNYKVSGTALATTAQTAILTAGTNETFIIRSIKVTNLTSNTPTITLDVTDTSATTTYQYLRTQSLSANASLEVINKPLVLESADILKATMSATDSINIVITFLKIFDEKSS